MSIPFNYLKVNEQRGTTIDPTESLEEYQVNFIKVLIFSNITYFLLQYYGDLGTILQQKTAPKCTRL